MFNDKNDKIDFEMISSIETDYKSIYSGDISTREVLMNDGNIKQSGFFINFYIDGFLFQSTIKRENIEKILRIAYPNGIDKN